jgi:hypothetical protein
MKLPENREDLRVPHPAQIARAHLESFSGLHQLLLAT